MECFGTERAKERVMYCGQRRICRGEGGQGLADVGGLLSIWFVVISDPSQLPRHFSGSVALLKSQFVFMSTAPVATKDHEESWGLGSHMCPCLCPTATPLQGLSRSEWPELPPRITVASGGELLLNDWVQDGIARVLLRSVTSVAILGHTAPLVHYLGGL